MSEFHWAADAVLLADLLIRVGFSIRIIMRRLPVGVALAWLSIVLVFPFAGAVIYLLIGESRLGQNRRRRAKALRDSYRGWAKAAREAGQVVAPELASCAQGLARLGETLLQSPPLAGNEIHLLRDAGEAFPALIRDIDAARHTCHLEFYIWDVGGKADEVVEALLRAAARGVTCRVLVDAVGSKRFLRSDRAAPPARRRRRAAGGPAGHAAPSAVRPRRPASAPQDRGHRRRAGLHRQPQPGRSRPLQEGRRRRPVGGRLRPGARPGRGCPGRHLPLRLGAGNGGGDPRSGRGARTEAAPGAAVVQVLPPGPGERVGAIEQVLLAAIYAASRELVLTTPYFVPDESLLAALLSAPGRGVDVTLIVPAKVDSRMTHYASRAYQADLLAAGVRIALYQGGLLHTKSLAVDGQFSLFGSLNLDPRSLRLDFEVTLAVYDAEFTAALRRLQQSYLEKSVWLDLAACHARSALERFTEDAARLVGPLL